jgi:hypothetical protein
LAIHSHNFGIEEAEIKNISQRRRERGDVLLPLCDLCASARNFLK